MQLDFESIAYNHPWDMASVVVTLMDWRGGREGRRQRPEAKRRRIESDRERRLGRHLQWEHEYCDSTEWVLHSELQSRRPGAREPWVSCHGCPFSYFERLPSPARDPQRRRLTARPWHYSHKPVAA